MSNTTATPAPTTASPASPTQTPSQQSSLTPPSSSAAPPTSAGPSTPVNLPPSSTPAPPPSSAPSSSAPPPSSQSQSQPPPPSAQSTTTAPTPTPSTETSTSITTISPANGGPATPSTVVVTRTTNNNPTSNAGQSSPPPTDTSAPGLQNPKGDGSDGGLSTGGKTAIAVVVPVVVVALLLIGGIVLWRRRKAKKNAEDARRKEVEEYGFNPNHDPTLPAVGMQSEMAEDQSGYRGWGNTTTSSNRKASATLTSGLTYSDSNSNPGGYQSPNSPTQGYSETHSGDPLVNGRRETLELDGIGTLAAVPNANQNQDGVHRGPSNASSSYSAADRSDNSGEYPLPANNQQDRYGDNNQGYYHASPYDPNGYGPPPQPIIRDVSARRNTRIESPSVFPQQGNSGIAQNF